MSEGSEQRRRAQSLGEEIANSVSHGVGLLAALIAAPALVIDAIQRGDMVGIVGARLMIAINNDAKSPIFEQVDYGIVDDCREFVPVLIQNQDEGNQL